MRDERASRRVEAVDKDAIAAEIGAEQELLRGSKTTACACGPILARFVRARSFVAEHDRRRAQRAVGRTGNIVKLPPL